MGGDNVMDQLDGLDDVWPDADEESGFSSIPDGKANLKLIDATIGNSQSSGRLQVVFKWQVMEYLKTKDGPNADQREKLVGREHTSTQGLDTAQSLGFMKKDIRAFEVEVPAKLGNGGLEGALDEMIGRVVTCAIKNKEGWCNVYPNQLASSAKRGTSRRSSGGGGSSKAGADAESGDF